MEGLNDQKSKEMVEELVIERRLQNGDDSILRDSEQPETPRKIVYRSKRLKRSDRKAADDSDISAVVKTSLEQIDIDTTLQGVEASAKPRARRTLADSKDKRKCRGGLLGRALQQVQSERSATVS